jgi:hypothetical protein
MPRASASIAVAAAIVCLVPVPAHADDKQACIAASEDAQQLRIDGKLLKARARLLECARPECPAIVRQDCTQWMADVVAATPSVVLGARDAQGHDVWAVRASMDGAPLAERLDGRPVLVDPGVHVFRFESTAAPGVAADAQVLVRAGEKNREIAVTLAVPAAPGAPGAPETAAPGSTAAPASSGGGVPALAWVFGGVAVAALGTALAFDVAQALDYNHLSDTCAGHCSPDDVNHVATERWIAGSAAGVGVLALGAAAYVLFTRSSAARATASPPVGVEVVALPRGAVGVVAGRF